MPWRRPKSKMRHTRSFGNLSGAERRKEARIPRADAIHKDFVELTDVAPIGDRQRQHVPEREAQVIHQHLAPRLGRPLGGIDGGKQRVHLMCAGVEIDLGRHVVDQRADRRRVIADEALRRLRLAPAFRRGQSAE